MDNSRKKRARTIPPGWALKRIGDYAILTSGGTPLSTRRDFYEPSSIPWINSGEVGLGAINDTKNFISELGLKNSSAKFVPAGSVLVAMYGANAGKVSILNFQATTNQAICAIQPCIEFNSLFLKYNLDSLYDYLVGVSSGSARDNLSVGCLSDLTVCMPTLEVQQKIAAVLSALDAKIDLNNRINTELEAMAKTLYDYWFVQFDFPDVNGRPYKSSGGKMVYNEKLKRDIPVGWGDGTLDDVGQIVGGSTPSTKNPNNFSTNGIPWITPNDLSGNIHNKFITRGAMDVSVAGMKSASLKKYPAGTVLLTSRAPIGYMAIARGEVTTNQGFKSFIPLKGYSSAVVFYTVKTVLPVILKHGSGSTFQEISGAVLKMVPVCLPVFEVAEAFTSKINPIFDRQNILEQENQHLASLRDWLLPMLMNGQVQVT